MNEGISEKKSNAFTQILRAIGYGGVYLGGQIAAGAVVGFVTSFILGYRMAKEGIDPSRFSELYMEQVGRTTGIMVIVAAVLSILFLLIFFKIRKEKMSEKINFRKVKGKTIAGLAAVGVAFNLLTMSVMSFLPESVMNNYAESAKSVSGTDIFTFLGVVLVAPVIEEIFFRGLIFDRLKKGMPVVLAGVISAVVFGLAHGQILWACYTTVLGLLFAYVYHKTGSILATIVLHIAYNLTSEIGNLLPFEITNGVLYITTIFAVAAVIAGLIIVRKRNIKKNQAEVHLTA